VKILKEVTLKLPDWAYQYFIDKWPEDKRSVDKEFNLEWYVSWKISEMVGDRLQKESLASAGKGTAGGNKPKDILGKSRRAPIMP
jgi:hypothetical protein